MDVDELQTAGLYHPDQPRASERLALLQHLAERGATLEQMMEAAGSGQLVSLGADLTLFGAGETLTVGEAARRTGVSRDRVLRIRLASGLPVDPTSVLPVSVLDVLAAFQFATELFGEGPTLGFTRVMAASMARIAEAAVGLFLGEVEPALAAGSATELARAEANEAAMAALEGLPVVLGQLLLEHMAVAVRRTRAARAPHQRGQDVTVAVGFVDLVDSTGWTEQLSLKEHAVALSRFESAAWDLTTRRGGRVVKLIGDEAMFVASSASSACHIAVDLCRATSRDPALPAARGAVGFGAVLAREGDYFGTLINLVARCVKAADPGGVVVTAAARDQLAEADHDWSLSELVPQTMRGFDVPVRLFAVR